MLARLSGMYVAFLRAAPPGSLDSRQATIIGRLIDAAKSAVGNAQYADKQKAPAECDGAIQRLQQASSLCQGIMAQIGKYPQLAAQGRGIIQHISQGIQAIQSLKPAKPATPQPAPQPKPAK
jgi:hypothetical protein